MRALFIPAVLSMFPLAACDGAAGTTTNSKRCDPASDRTTYPAGPYGTTEGSVLANHSFINADTSTISIGDIFKDSKNRLLLVSTSAGWCTACIDEQPALIERHNKHSASGLYIMISTFEDAMFKKATGAYAAQWKRQYNIPFTVVADGPFVFDAYYDSAQTPMNMLVDVDTMKILKILIGFDQVAVDAIIETKVCTP